MPTDPAHVGIDRVLGADAGAAVKARLAEAWRNQTEDGVGGALAEALGRVPWPGAIAAALDQVDALMAAPLGPVLAKTYAGADVLGRYLEPDAVDPEAITFVELAQHRVETVHSPRLELVLDGAVIGALTFEVRLHLELDGAVLKVQDARVLAVTPGRGRGVGEVALHGSVLLRRETERLELPEIALGDGIALAP